MVTFDQFIEKVDSVYEKNNELYVDKLRYGQTLMNVLHDVWRDKYYEITNTEYDCFYKDDTVRYTVGKLEKEWKNIKYQKVSFWYVLAWRVFCEHSRI
jgi:hypothetical protein